MDALRCAKCHKYIPSKEMPSKEEYQPPIGSFDYYCRECLKELKDKIAVKESNVEHTNVLKGLSIQYNDRDFLHYFIMKEFKITEDQYNIISNEFYSNIRYNNHPIKDVVLGVYHPEYDIPDDPKFSTYEFSDLDDLGGYMLSIGNIPDLVSDDQFYKLSINSSKPEISICEHQKLDLIEFFGLKLLNDEVDKIHEKYNKVIDTLITFQNELN